MVDDINNSESPVDPREVCRAICLQRGAVPDLKKGQSVWASNGPFWYEAVIERRLPGGVYAARFVDLPRAQSFKIVSASTFGGLCE